MNSPTACIVDANILIDLHAGGVLEALFRLPYRFLTADVILSECKSIPSEEVLLSWGIERHSLSGKYVAQAYEILATQGRISANDCFALVLAQIHHGTLVTGDRRLTALGLKAGLEVHGTLWALDQMVQQGVLAGDAAARALNAMRLTGSSRFPEDECARLIEKWQQFRD